MEVALRQDRTTLQTDDATLVREVQAGRTDAFAHLVTRYQDRVFNACWRICGHPDDASDLTQEAFLKAFSAIATFQGKSGFYTWLFRIAMNLALSQRKRVKLRYVASLDDDGDRSNAERVPDRRSVDPSDRAATNEVRDRLARALGELDAHHRVVIVLRDIEAFDYERIAHILGVAVGTVKSRVFRARKALRERMEDNIDA